MSKISQTVTEQDGKLLIQETHDFNPTLERAAKLRSAGMIGDKEKRLVGLIPMKMWAEWAKAAGVRVDDHGAMREVVARNLANPDYAHLRVWEGRF